MTALTEKLSRIHEELNKIEDTTFYHYWRPAKVKSEYGVWAEDGEQDSFNGDNIKLEQQIHGTVDYFTLKEFNPVLDEIQEALQNVAPGAWSLLSVQYEDETNLIHYEWEFVTA